MDRYLDDSFQLLAVKASIDCIANSFCGPYTTVYNASPRMKRKYAIKVANIFILNTPVYNAVVLDYDDLCSLGLMLLNKLGLQI